MSAQQGRLTQERVDRLAAEIKLIASSARQQDPDTKGRLSYPAMCGGLQAVVCNLVRELAGGIAETRINQVFEAAWQSNAHTETPDAGGTA